MLCLTLSFLEICISYFYRATQVQTRARTRVIFTSLTSCKSFYHVVAFKKKRRRELFVKKILMKIVVYSLILSSFSLWIIIFPPYPHPPPPPTPLLFFFSLINQCDRRLVPSAWGLTAGGRRFTSHGGVTLSRACLRKKWKPLDIPGTLQLLKWNK